MKRLPEILILSCLTIGPLIKGTFGNRFSNLVLPISSSEIIHDTTGYTRLIQTDTFNLSILPPSSGVQFYKDGIVFLSLSKNEEKMSSKHISFGTTDAYFAKLEDTTLGRHMIFSPSSPFTYPCEATTFNHEYDTMYFTKYSSKEKKEKIYLARFISGTKTQSGWLSEKAPLNFCTDNCRYAYPAISNDGKILIFSSDMQSSTGGMDLYVTRKDGDKWTVPVNLGTMINTKGNEFFPFLDSENNLFFSSDLLPGYGGYDVFTCKFNGKTWDQPMNLSNRINSEQDEIAFTIDKRDGKTAFYTKRQKSGKGEMQLFRVSLNKEAVNSNLLTISYIFNGKPVLSTGLTASGDISQVNRTEVPPLRKEPAIEEPKKESEVKVQKPEVLAEGKKEKVSVPDTTANLVASRPLIITPDASKEMVIYRVQFLSSPKSQKENKLVVDGETYNIFEYFYLGEYRYTIGEFKSLNPAIQLMNTCRRSGYPQSFVAAFKNNVRSLDQKLFK